MPQFGWLSEMEGEGGNFLNLLQKGGYPERGGFPQKKGGSNPGGNYDRGGGATYKIWY